MRISLTDILSRFRRNPGPEGLRDGLEPVQERDLQPGQGESEPQEDAELTALSQEMESLGTLAVPAAAKERTWATVREEVRSGGAQMPTTRRARKHRNTRIRRRRPTEAAGALAVAVAGVLAVSGVPSADSNGGELADSGDSGGSETTVVSEGTTAPGPSTTTPTTGEEDTYTVQDTYTVPSSRTTSTVPSVSTTSSSGDTTSGTEAASTSTTGGGNSTTTQTTSAPDRHTTTSTVAPSPTTTEPAQSVLAREEREGSARSAAQYLTLSVVEDDLAGADSVVTNGAHQGLVQMASSLHDPYGYRMISVTPGTGNSVRVIVEVKDRRSDRSGGVQELTPRFLYEVRVDEGGALVEYIYAAPGG